MHMQIYCTVQLFGIHPLNLFKIFYFVRHFYETRLEAQAPVM